MEKRTRFGVQRRWIADHPEVVQAVPALLTALMVVGSVLYYPWRHYSSWPSDLIVLGFFILIAWHLALIARLPGQRPWLILYAIMNVGTYAFVGFICLTMVTGDAL
jgi:hypothetical protein